MRIKSPNTNQIQQVYAVLALVSTAVGVGEKIHHYYVINRKRRTHAFGFNTGGKRW